MADNRQRHRLFFALWPDDMTRQRIIDQFTHDTRHSAGYQALTSSGLIARPVPQQNLHITLHFLGNVSTGRMACVRSAAKALDRGAFDIRLDHYGYFSGVDIFWMGVHASPPLLQLYDGLQSVLRDCGVKPDHRAYRPHVSLVRQFGEDAGIESSFSIAWKVNRFVLMESIQEATGVHYRLVQSYPLRQSGPDKS